MKRPKTREILDNEYHFRKTSATEKRRMVKNWTKEYMQHYDEIDKLEYFQSHLR